MRNKIKAFFKSKFIAALLMVSGGSVVAQVLNFAFQPIISRLYSVEEFGEYAVYASILTIASVVVSLAYDQAIVSAKDNDEAQRLMFGTVYLSGILCLLMTILLACFRDIFLSWINLDHCDWLYILPINVFLLCFYNLITSYNYRTGKYRSIGVAACVRSGGMGVMQVLLFYVGVSSIGLSLGRVIALLICSAPLVYSILISGISIKNGRLDYVKKAFKNNYQFPVFQFPASFVDRFLDATITFAILLLYTQKELGIYSLVIQVLGMPINLVSTSLRKLCISEFNKNRDDVQASKKLYIRVAIGMGLLIGVGMLALCLIAEPLFVGLFGEKWSGAGLYIQGLALLYAVKFVTYPLSSVSVVKEKQNIFLLFQVFLVITSLLALGIAKLLSTTIFVYLIILSVGLSSIYILQSIVFYKVLTRNKTEE